jgi:hypothetical protein
MFKKLLQIFFDTKFKKIVSIAVIAVIIFSASIGTWLLSKNNQVLIPVSGSSITTTKSYSNQNKPNEIITDNPIDEPSDIGTGVDYPGSGDEFPDDIIYPPSEDDVGNSIQTYGIATYSPSKGAYFASSFPLKTQIFSIDFKDGIPSSFKTPGMLGPDGTPKEIINTYNDNGPGPGTGFTIGQNAPDGSMVPVEESRIKLDKLYFETDPIDSISYLYATTKNENGPVVKILVNITDKYLGFRIKDVQNYPRLSRETFINFNLNTSESFAKSLSFDYMTTTSATSGNINMTFNYVYEAYTANNDDPNTRVYIKKAGAQEEGLPKDVTYLKDANGKAVSWGNPYGGFAVYCKASSSDEDDTYTRIWANEGMAHPNIEDWTVKTAKEWIQNWISETKNFSRIIVGPRTPLDLTEDSNGDGITDIVDATLKAGTKQAYLYRWNNGVDTRLITDIFAVNTTKDQEVFNDKNVTFVELNKDRTAIANQADMMAFKNGISTMIDFSKSLNDQGKVLSLHKYATGIDTRYNSSSFVTNDIESWGAGKVTAIQGTKVTIKPDKGTTLPCVSDGYTKYPGISTSLYTTQVQINNKIFSVGNAFTDTVTYTKKYQTKPNGDPVYDDGGKGILQYVLDQNGEPVWEYKVKDGIVDLTVNNINTANETWTFSIGTSTGVKVGDTFKGLISSGAGIMPSKQGQVMFNLAYEYASLIDVAKLGNAEFDGAEFATGNGTWGYQKWGALIYSFIDHPVTAHDSGQMYPAAFFEYQFNCVSSWWNNKEGNIAFANSRDGSNSDATTAGKRRETTRPYDVSAEAAISVANGYARNTILAPENGGDSFSIRNSFIKNNGLYDYTMEKIAGWNYIKQSLTKEISNIIAPSSGGHTKYAEGPGIDKFSDFFIHKDANGKVTSYEIYQIRNMTKRTGNIFYQTGVEFQPTTPQDYLKIGDTIELNNIFQKQEPEFVIRALPQTNYTSTSNKTISSSAINLSYSNTSSNDTWVDKITLSGTVSKQVNVSIDVNANRALGMWITGDGSGSILVVRPQNAIDYAVTIDFIGKKYIEIPIPTASWGTGDWGILAGFNEGRDAQSSNNFIFTLGKVPKNTNANITVEGAKMLYSNNTVYVKNLTVKTANGYLKINDSVGVKPYDYIWHQKLADGTFKTTIQADSNFALVRDVTNNVVTNNFTVPEKYGKITIIADKQNGVNWVSTQFLTQNFDPEKRYTLVVK